MDNEIRMPHKYQEPVAASESPSVEGVGAKIFERTIDTDQTYSWGWLPALCLTSAFGLLLISVADTLSRLAAGKYESLFWAGLLVIIVPIAARLASSTPTRRERIGLILLTGLGFYLVKILHSPYGFTFSDELIHSYNVTRILETGKLFSLNPILSVTPFYPGLETVTAALASLSGQSIFGAGLIVVGIARLIAMLALFLFFEEISGSLRLAGIAALLYVTNPNFLFWSAQFSYESLSLPLGIWVIYVAARRAVTPNGVQHRGLTLIALLGITAVVITHHLTSYFLVVFFVTWTLISLILRLRAARRSSTPNTSQIYGRREANKSQGEINPDTGAGVISEPAGLILFSISVTLIWLFGVARITPSYLSPVIGRAVSSMIQIISGAAGTRVLFQSTSGYVAPTWERLVGIGSVILLLLAMPFGLRRIWQDYRKNPLVLTLTGAGLTYFAVLGLRLSPAAWETANRASEFLFIGLVFVAAFAVQELWDRRRGSSFGRGAVLGSIAVILMGGVIAGWTPALRLSQPLQVNVGNVVIKPQGYSAADWMRAALGPGNRVATNESDARLMLAYGEQVTFSGKYPDIQDMLGTVDFADWQAKLIQDWDIQYIAVDRRLISSDIMSGYYFDRTTTGQLPGSQLIAPELYGKFDKQQTISRIYDSGDIVIYNVGVIRDATTIK